MFHLALALGPPPPSRYSYGHTEAQRPVRRWITNVQCFNAILVDNIGKGLHRARQGPTPSLAFIPKLQRIDWYSKIVVQRRLQRMHASIYG